MTKNLQNLVATLVNKYLVYGRSPITDFFIWVLIMWCDVTSVVSGSRGHWWCVTPALSGTRPRHLITDHSQCRVWLSLATSQRVIDIILLVRASQVSSVMRAPCHHWVKNHQNNVGATTESQGCPRIMRGWGWHNCQLNTTLEHLRKSDHNDELQCRYPWPWRDIDCLYVPSPRPVIRPICPPGPQDAGPSPPLVCVSFHPNVMSGVTLLPPDILHTLTSLYIDHLKHGYIHTVV